MNQQTALLVMDMQSSILQNLPDPQSILEKAAAAIGKARKRDIPVLYVAVSLRPGLPEISPNNKGFMAFKERITKVPMETFSAIHPAIAPANNEIIIYKKRYSAFTGSDLQVVLSALGIEHLVLMGVSTSGVVLSTLREAADKDYALTVLSDGCFDADEEVHRVLTTKVFPRQAMVLTVAEWQP